MKDLLAKIIRTYLINFTNGKEDPRLIESEAEYWELPEPYDYRRLCAILEFYQNKNIQQDQDFVINKHIMGKLLNFIQEEVVGAPNDNHTILLSFLQKEIVPLRDPRFLLCIMNTVINEFNRGNADLSILTAAPRSGPNKGLSILLMLFTYYYSLVIKQDSFLDIAIEAIHQACKTHESFFNLVATPDEEELKGRSLLWYFFGVAELFNRMREKKFLMLKEVVEAVFNNVCQNPENFSEMIIAPEIGLYQATSLLYIFFTRGTRLKIMADYYPKLLEESVRAIFEACKNKQNFPLLISSPDEGEREGHSLLLVLINIKNIFDILERNHEILSELMKAMADNMDDKNFSAITKIARENGQQNSLLLLVCRVLNCFRAKGVDRDALNRLTEKVSKDSPEYHDLFDLDIVASAAGEQGNKPKKKKEMTSAPKASTSTDESAPTEKKSKSKEEKAADKKRGREEKAAKKAAKEAIEKAAAAAAKKAAKNKVKEIETVETSSELLETLTAGLVRVVSESDDICSRLSNILFKIKSSSLNLKDLETLDEVLFEAQKFHASEETSFILNVDDILSILSLFKFMILKPATYALPSSDKYVLLNKVAMTLGRLLYFMQEHLLAGRLQAQSNQELLELCMTMTYYISLYLANLPRSGNEDPRDVCVFLYTLAGLMHLASSLDCLDVSHKQYFNYFLSNILESLRLSQHPESCLVIPTALEIASGLMCDYLSDPLLVASEPSFCFSTTLERLDQLIFKFQTQLVNASTGVMSEKFIDMLACRMKLIYNDLSAYSRLGFFLNQAIDYLSSDPVVTFDKINAFFKVTLNFIERSICLFSTSCDGLPFVAALSSTESWLEKLMSIMFKCNSLESEMADSIKRLRSNITLFQQNKTERQAPQEKCRPA